MHVTQAASVAEYPIGRLDQLSHEKTRKKSEIKVIAWHILWD